MECSQYAWIQDPRSHQSECHGEEDRLCVVLQERQRKELDQCGQSFEGRETAVLVRVRTVRYHLFHVCGHSLLPQRVGGDEGDHHTGCALSHSFPLGQCDLLR